MKRKARTHGRSRWKVALVLAVVAGLSGGGWALARSRVFALSRIDVTGVTTPSLRDDVVTASGLHPGQGAIGIDVRAIEERIEALSWVASADVHRRGSLAVVIDVEPRVAAALVESGDREFYVDATGHPVPIAPKGDVPRIEMPDARALRHAGAAPEECVRLAIAFWTSVPAKRRAGIHSIEPRSCASVVFKLGRVPVTFGGLDRVAEKFQAIDLVFARAAADDRLVRSLDVSVPEHPAARLSG